MFREAAGAAGDVRGIVATALRAVHTRLELMAIEAQAEKAWALRFMVAALAALYLLTFGLMLAIVAVVLFAAEENRPAIVAACAAVFLLAGIAGVSWIRSSSRGRGPLFSETIAVLKGDERGLRELMRGTGD